MLGKHVKRSIVLVMITLSILAMFIEGYATGPDVTLVVNPKATEIHAGAEKIVITVDATGKNLTFTWKLSGPGKLEDEGAAAFYIPPEKIDQESASAVVTVTVKEPSGQETVKSVAFTILPSLAPPAIPSPVTTPSEKKKMSKGTITALSLGAVAALGGGIALAVGGGGDDKSPTGCVTSCAGVMVGCYCWYLGADNESCTQVCASHGFYHEATRTYAGSHGTDSNCWAVLSALGAPANTSNVISTSVVNSTGCHYWIITYQGQITEVRWTRSTRYTTADADGPDDHRACACNR